MSFVLVCTMHKNPAPTTAQIKPHDPRLTKGTVVRYQWAAVRIDITGYIVDNPFARDGFWYVEILHDDPRFATWHTVRCDRIVPC